MLKDYFDGYKVMVRKYPKAARKRRIIKKWKRRFGVGVSDLMEEMRINRENFWRSIPTDDNWRGNVIQIPMFINDNFIISST